MWHGKPAHSMNYGIQTCNTSTTLGSTTLPVDWQLGSRQGHDIQEYCTSVTVELTVLPVDWQPGSRQGHLYSQPRAHTLRIYSIQQVAQVQHRMSARYLLTGSLAAGRAIYAASPGPTLIQHRLDSPGLAVPHLASATCTQAELG